MTNLQIAKLYLATNSTATAAEIDTAVTDGSALTSITALSAAAFLEASYQAAFGRSVDAEGTAAYLTKLENGTITQDDFADILIAGAAIYVSAGDATIAALNAADVVIIPLKAAADAAASSASVGTVAATVATVVDATTSTAAIATIDAADAAADAAANAGETFMLTTGSETVTGTDLNDTINGTYSALSTTRTLDTTDVIDGGEGTDAININIDGTFAGFTANTGSMTNVETVNLTNEGTVARTFTAAEVTGVTQYNLDGAVNLASLDSMMTIEAGARTSALTIAYANTVTDGTTDTLALGLTDNGTVDDAATIASEEVAVTVTVAGIETTDLNVSGTNVLNLNGLASVDLTATGTGSVKINDLDAATKTLDASGVEGAVDVTLGTAASMTSVKTGLGDDTITVITSSDLTANATISGSEGADNLELTGNSNSTTQYTQTGIETMTFGALTTGTVTMSLKNTTGVETLVATKDMAQSASLSTVGAGDLVIDVQGVNANAATLSSDHTGTSTITVSTPATAATVTSPSANTTNVTVSGTTSVNLTVDSMMSYGGTVTAAAATSVIATLNGAATAASVISAAAATSVVLTAVDAASDLDIIAAAALDVNITNAKALTLTGATDLTAAESFVTSGAGALTMTGMDLAAANTVNITNTGAVDVGIIGATTLAYSSTVTATNNASLIIEKVATNNQNITINATGVAGTITIGDATNAVTAGTGNTSITLGAGSNVSLSGAISGTNVTIDAEDVLGTMAYTHDITAQNFTFTAAQLTNNDLDGSAGNVVLTGATNTISLTGGIANDTFLFDADNATTTVIATGDLNIGTDTLAFDFETAATIAQAYSLNISGLSDYDTSTITLSSEAFASTVTLAAGTDADTIAWSGAQKSTISGFDTTEDTLDFDAVSAAVGGTVTAVTSGARTAAKIVDGDLYVISDGATALTAAGSEAIADYTDLTDVAAYLDEGFTDAAGAAATDEAIFIVNDLAADKTYVYHYVEGDALTPNVVDADELTIIGVITEESGAALVAGDIA